MNTSKSDERTTAPSQRPTLEIVDDDALEFSTLPPSEAPVGPDADRSTVPGSARASWSVLTPAAPLPVGFELRLLLGVLRALTPMHTNLQVPPDERVYGRVCRQNVRVDPDGTVGLSPRDEAVEPSGDLRAPEELGQEPIDQQADLYSVGALVLAALEREPIGETAWLDSVRSIAARAVRLDRRARWTSASEFAAQLEAAAGTRLPSQQALCVLLRGNQTSGTSPSEAASVRQVAESIPDADVMDELERASIRPTVEIIADGDEQAHTFIDATGDRYEPIDCMDNATPVPAKHDSDEEPAPLSFDNARLATSTVPGEPPARNAPPLRKEWLLGVVTILLLGVAGWGATSITTLRGTQPDVTRASLQTEVARVQPEAPRASAPATNPTANPTPTWEQTQAPNPRPRPSVTGSFPAMPAPTAKTAATPRPSKANATRPRLSTYDPEGI